MKIFVVVLFTTITSLVYSSDINAFGLKPFADRYTLKTKPTDSIEKHSIKKAALWSTFLPGAGQVYNHIAMPKGKKKAFWKVPLIYAGIGTLGYFFLENQSLVKELKGEYTNRIDLNTADYLEKYSAYDNQSVLTLYQTHQTRRDLFLIGTILVYALQVVDAAVEAHFVDFDVSENLSLHIRPKMYDYRSAGVGLSLKFR